MEGIKEHTHKDRKKIINSLLPIFRRKFNKNLIAVAADGSFARNEDQDYSDIELIIFLKKFLKRKWEYRKIVNGMLIVAITETKKSYINKYLRISENWFASGASKLLPIINDTFINDINKYKIKVTKQELIKEMKDKWLNLQEITAKVLNNIKYYDKEALVLSFPLMLRESLVIMAYLNSSPYLTLGEYIKRAKKFELRPKGFDHLISTYLSNNYLHDRKLFNTVESVFSDLEDLCEIKSIYKSKL